LYNRLSSGAIDCNIPANAADLEVVLGDCDHGFVPVSRLGRVLDERINHMDDDLRGGHIDA
jgi:hypothetical protein